MNPAQVLRPLEHDALQAQLEAHRRFLSGRGGGRRANFSYVDLSHVGFEGVDLREAEFTGARLFAACLAGAKLDRATLYGCDLRNADLRGANLRGADLSRACLREGRIALYGRDEGLRILKPDARDNELDYAVVEGANFEGVRLTEEVQSPADCTDADMREAVLGGAKLHN